VGAQAVPLDTVDATLVDVAQPGQVGTYFGASIVETGGTNPVLVYIREGSASGRVIDVLKLAAGGSENTWYGPQGKNFSGDLFQDVVSGTGVIAGSVFVA